MVSVEMLLSGGGSLGGMSHSANAGSVAGNHDNGDGLPRVPINDVVVCIEDTTVMGTTVDELYDTYLLPWSVLWIYNFSSLRFYIVLHRRLDYTYDLNCTYDTTLISEVN